MSDRHNYSYNRRYVALITVEADTPLSVGSGANDLITDSPVCVDCNLIPMIQGTSWAGVLRHQFAEYLGKEGKDAVNKIFGFQEKDKGEGSRIILSSAHIIAEGNRVIEGMANSETVQNSSYLSQLSDLPVREHCKINHKGVSDQESHGKYDQQAVYKGTRFRFEMELIGTKEDEKVWNDLLAILSNPIFRIGGGTRKGFGKLKIVSIKSRIFDLTQPQDMEDYLNKSASLNWPDSGATTGWSDSLPTSGVTQAWVKYILTISPESTWMFGSGFSDDEVDMTPVYEKVVVWDNGTPSFSARKILIPATSVKGAISHRLAYHYNRLKEYFADRLPAKKHDIKDNVGENNEAVQALFGCAKESSAQNGQIGNVILSDVFMSDQQKTKIFNHVSIDRFTGGAMDSALFDEKVLTQKETVTMEILVKQSVLSDINIQKAWEATLEDICKGLLPLGGSVMRGHGVFQGAWIKKEAQ